MRKSGFPILLLELLLRKVQIRIVKWPIWKRGILPIMIEAGIIKVMIK